MVTAGTSSVSVAVHALVAEATLEHSAPLNYVVPGQRLDLLLHVITPGGYTVPLQDFTASVGLDRVQLYEGPVLIVSSNSSDYGQAGVAQLSLTAGGWSMAWPAPSEDGVTVTVVAIDSSGNEASASRTLTIDGPTEVTLAAGGSHGLAILEDGTVAAWGDNGYGQTSVPVGLSDVVAVAAGAFHSLALKSDGTVVAWGHFYATDPPPSGLSGVVAIAANGDSNLALKSDGSVVGWGVDNPGWMSIPTDLVIRLP